MIRTMLGRPVDADAGRRNMWLLIQLRWIAVVGQLVTILAVRFAMGIHVPMAPLLTTLAVLAGINLIGIVRIHRRFAVGPTELTAAMLIDVAALAWQLRLTGGLQNPFISLFLLQIVIGAMLLRSRRSWIIFAAAGLGLAGMALRPVPLPLAPPFDDPFGLYLAGSLVCFAMIAVLLVLLVTRISRNLSDRDAALATARQRAAEEDHIVRMGLLASGAAHELGTPLSSMSVILNDWQRMPVLASDAELALDIADMQAEVQRCKTIVGGILFSAGEARGVAPEFTTVRRFLSAIVGAWRANRLPATLDYVDAFGPDLAIVSDPALRQVIGNVIDNAAEASPDWIGVAARREDDKLIIEVSDRGPGFPQEILDDFGKPYRSTKGKPGGGLGLFLLVNVLRKLGGTAHATNRASGGAVVRIILPLAAIVRDAHDVAHERPQSTGDRRG